MVMGGVCLCVMLCDGFPIFLNSIELNHQRFSQGIYQLQLLRSICECSQYIITLFEKSEVGCSIRLYGGFVDERPVFSESDLGPPSS